MIQKITQNNGNEQSTLLCKQKLLTSRQIFRYAVPAHTVTKKHWIIHNNNITTDNNDDVSMLS